MPTTTTTTEASLEGTFRRELHRIGGLVVKLAPVTKGTPDRMVLLDGNIYLVELKTETGRLSPAQRAWHEKATQRGVEVVVLYGRAEVEEWVALVASMK